MPVLRCHKAVRYIAMNVFFLRYIDCAISPKKYLSFLRQHKSRYRSASLTTEAALVFPVFFFSVYMMWQFFLLLLFQLDVCHEVADTAMQYAHLGYPERKAEAEDVDISWIYYPLLWNSVPEYDQAKGMLVICEAQEDGSIQVDISYRFVCKAVFFAELEIPVEQSLRFYPYLGETDEDLFSVEEKKEVVYMTEHGTVYHESRACVYLTVTVREVALTEVSEERNSSGKKYTECARCKDDTERDSVYLSSGGTKFHRSLNCPALKRNVMEKSREEVEGISACHKCGTKQEDTK